jgi:two-component sensor histidine kinase
MINFKSSDRGQLILVVSDNGIGLPENFDLQKTESLGLQIVVALTNQLQGEIEFERTNGTEFMITFPE